MDGASPQGHPWKIPAAAASHKDWEVMIEHVTVSPDIVSGLLNLDDAR